MTRLSICVAFFLIGACPAIALMVELREAYDHRALSGKKDGPESGTGSSEVWNSIFGSDEEEEPQQQQTAAEAGLIATGREQVVGEETSKENAAGETEKERRAKALQKSKEEREERVAAALAKKAREQKELMERRAANQAAKPEHQKEREMRMRQEEGAAAEAREKEALFREAVAVKEGIDTTEIKTSEAMDSQAQESEGAHSESEGAVEEEEEGIQTAEQKAKSEAVAEDILAAYGIVVKEHKPESTVIDIEGYGKIDVNKDFRSTKSARFFASLHRKGRAVCQSLLEDFDQMQEYVNDAMKDVRAMLFKEVGAQNYRSDDPEQMDKETEKAIKREKGFGAPPIVFNAADPKEINASRNTKGYAGWSHWFWDARNVTKASIVALNGLTKNITETMYDMYDFKWKVHKDNFRGPGHEANIASILYGQVMKTQMARNSVFASKLIALVKRRATALFSQVDLHQLSARDFEHLNTVEQATFKKEWEELNSLPQAIEAALAKSRKAIQRTVTVGAKKIPNMNEALNRTVFRQWSRLQHWD